MKKIFLITAALSVCIALSGQTTKHEFSAYGAGGVSTLQYKLSKSGETNTKGGGAFGLGYTYYLASRFGITTGLDVAFYNASVSYGRISGKYDINDERGNPFHFFYTATNYNEEQQAVYLNIPVMGQLLFPLGSNPDSRVKIFAAGGFKFGLPISTSLTTTAGTLYTTGVYDHENQTYANMAQHGFVNETDNKGTGDLNLGFSCQLAIEAGARIRFAEAMGLYAGLYFDYGLNSIASDSNLPPIQYQTNDPAVLSHNSVVNSSYVKNAVTPFAAGIKIRFAFGK